MCWQIDVTSSALGSQVNPLSDSCTDKTAGREENKLSGFGSGFLLHSGLDGMPDGNCAGCDIGQGYFNAVHIGHSGPRSMGQGLDASLGSWPVVDISHAY